MTLTIEPKGLEFAAVVHGLKVTGPVSADIIEQLREGLDRHLLLVIPGSDLDDEALVAFARGFGEVEEFGLGYGNSVSITNLDSTGQALRAADHPGRGASVADALWHTDSSFRPYRARYSMLAARTVPSAGGETQYCDTRAAYDALPEATKRKIEGLTAVHSIIHSRILTGFTDWSDEDRAALPPSAHPLVLTNLSTRRRSIYLASHICEIEGWAPAETRALVEELTAFATQPRFVHQHAWSVGDLAIWDDRATMHRRMPYEDLSEPRALTAVRVMDLPEKARRAAA